MDWPDYLILVSVIAISVLIGIWFGGCYTRRKLKSSEEYFLGNRQMYMLPIIASLLCSFVSSVVLIRIPEEIYFYGTQCVLLIISFIPATITLIYLYIPVFFNLQLSSPFEYFQLRFSRAVRVVISLVGIISMLIYISLVVFETSVVISEQSEITGIGLNQKFLEVGILVVCLISSTSGGLKAVLWVGTLQALVLLVSLFVLLGLGISSVENLSIDNAWKRAIDSNRIEIFNIDFDPRVRHTVWTSLIGGYFLCICLFGGTVGQIQRFIAVPTLQKTKISFILTMCLITLLVMVFLFISGLYILANYFECNLNEIMVISFQDSQNFVEFVIKRFGKFPGVAGLFIAGLLSCSLSSISNGLNSLAFTASHDYFKHWIPNISEKSLVFLSKLLTVAFGCFAFGLVIIEENFEDFHQDAWCIFVITIAAIFGTFSLGMFFPWANSKGTILGLIASLSLTLYAIFLRATFVSKGILFPDQKLPKIAINCPFANATYFEMSPMNATNIDMDNSSLPIDAPFYIPKLHSSASLDWKDLSAPESLLMHILEISPMWFAGISWILTIMLGLFFSLLLIKWERNWRVRPDCLSPPILKFWCKCFPIHMKKWVEPDENLVLLCSSFSVLPLDSQDYRFHKEPLCDVKFKSIQLADTSNY